jgi:hypothetical protein
MDHNPTDHSSIELIKMRPHQCPKYRHCNAPICPLDAHWKKRIYRKGEAICFYMLEAQKPKASSIFQGEIPAEICQAISIIIEDVKSKHAALRARLDRASLTRSRSGGPTL